MPSFDYFDEIWCPSDFVRESIALKAPFPVLTMPHSIGFERPGGRTGGAAGALRAARGAVPLPLPLRPQFLHGAQEPAGRRRGVPACRASPATGGASSSRSRTPTRTRPTSRPWRTAVRDIPGTVIISETLSRADVYAPRGRLRLLRLAPPLRGLRPRGRRVHVPRKARHLDQLVGDRGIREPRQRVSRATTPSWSSRRATARMRRARAGRSPTWPMQAS